MPRMGDTKDGGTLARRQLVQISHDNNDNDSCAFVDWHLEVSDLMNVGTYTRYF